MNHRNYLQAAFIIAIFVFLMGSSYATPIRLANAKNVAAIPVHPKKIDPSGSLVLSYGRHTWIPIQLLTGMNATFQVYSNVTLDIYFMSSSQFASFESTGSTQAIYHSQSSYVNVNIGPFLGGTYYLVIINDVSSQNASVIYSLSTLPVNIYSFHSSLPAPVGIADYGVLNASGVLHPYKILYREAIGMATIYSLQAYNSSPPAGISPYGVSLQQNVVLQVNTTNGNYEYWLQNVPNFLTNNEIIFFSGNIMNLSTFHSYLTNKSITGKGYVMIFGNDDYYVYNTQSVSYSLPLSLLLYTKCVHSDNAVYVSFGYSFAQTSPVTWYDNVTIHDTGVKSASLVVSGYSFTPRGAFYDSELVFGGEGNGELTNFTQMNAKLLMRYVLPNGSTILPPAVYGFGSDTAEAADDLSTALVNGYPTVLIGSGNFEPVAYSVSLPKYSAHISLQALPVDSGMRVPVKISSSTYNGLAPYTYFFYINGKPVYNFTTYSGQYSGTVYIPPLSSGTYSLQVAVYDALGRVNYSSVCTITVNPDPVASLTSNVSVTDVGLPCNISYSAHYGTAPYNFSLYINGNLVSKGYDSYSSYLGSTVFAPEQSGTLTAELVVMDSAGYTATCTLSVTANPDPVVSAYANASVTDLGLPVKLASSAVSGTPPYTFAWYVNGQEAVKNSAVYYFKPSAPGSYLVELFAKDSAGYAVTKSFAVTVNPDPVIKSFSVNTSSSNPLIINNLGNAKVVLAGGTPPYMYSWYLNGKPVANTTSPDYSYSFSVGQNYVQVKVSDSLGYSVTGQAIAVSTSYNYVLIGGIAAVIAVALLTVYMLKKRR